MKAENTANDADTEVLEKLNQDYIKSVQMSDVGRFEEILAQIARPMTISNLEARDVIIRVMGDVAIIHARTAYTKLDGQTAFGRYTDIWARRQGRWLAVAAHVTRG